MKKYKRLKKLGEGGFGVVYLARHRRTKKTVVLKISHAVAKKEFRFNPRESDASVQQSYERQMKIEKNEIKEEQAIFKLIYPNAPQDIEVIEEVDQSGNESYRIACALNYVEGSESTWLYENETALDNLHQLPCSQRMYAIQSYFAQLETLHKKGILHCDIKAANMMMRMKGDQYNLPDISLIDFGLALRADRPFDGRTKKDGRGTPITMAPEVQLHKVHGYGSDIYSSAAVMGKILGASVVSYLDFYNKLHRKKEEYFKSVDEPLSKLITEYHSEGVTEERKEVLESEYNTFLNTNPVGWAMYQISYTNIEYQIDVLEDKIKKLKRENYPNIKVYKKQLRVLRGKRIQLINDYSGPEKPILTQRYDELIKALREQVIKIQQDRNTVLDQHKTELDLLKDKLKDPIEGRRYYEEDRFQFSGIAASIQESLPSPEEFEEYGVDQESQISGLDVQLLCKQMTKYDMHDRPTSSELSSIFTMLYNITNAMEMIKRYEAVLKADGSFDRSSGVASESKRDTEVDYNRVHKAIAASALRDKETVLTFLHQMPDKHRKFHLKLKKPRFYQKTSKVKQRNEQAMRDYAADVEDQFVAAEVADILQKSGKERLTNPELSRVYLGSLKDQVAYYSALLSCCFEDLRKGKHRHGVAAVRFCFDRREEGGLMLLDQANVGDDGVVSSHQDAVDVSTDQAPSSTLSTGGGGGESKLSVSVGSHAAQSSTRTSYRLKECMRALIENSDGRLVKERLEEINKDRVSLGVSRTHDDIEYNESRGFYFKEQPSSFCHDLLACSHTVRTLDEGKDEMVALSADKPRQQEVESKPPSTMDSNPDEGIVDGHSDAVMDTTINRPLSPISETGESLSPRDDSFLSDDVQSRQKMAGALPAFFQKGPDCTKSSVDDLLFKVKSVVGNIDKSSLNEDELKQYNQLQKDLKNTGSFSKSELETMKKKADELLSKVSPDKGLAP